MSCAIDWVATGAMLSGSAAWITAPAIIIAALIGKSAVSDYREQKKADREIDVADKVLATSYQLRTAITDMRSTYADAYDHREARAYIAQKNNIEKIPEDQIGRIIQSRMIYQRAEKYEPLFDRAQEILAFARAYFPENVSEKFRGLAEVHKNLLRFADWYIEEPDSGSSISLDTENFIFAGGINGSPDNFAKTVDDDVSFLEKELFPIIRSSKSNQRNEE